MILTTGGASRRRAVVTRRVLLSCIVLTLSWSCGATREKRQANAQAADSDAASGEIKRLIAKYAAAVDMADTNLASEVWSNSPDVSFIHPRGHEHGWEEVKNFYENTMRALFSERKLSTRDVTVHVYGDSAWAEFYWHFVAKLRSDGSTLETKGRETQIYRKADQNRWVLVHVHYSGMPVTEPARGF